LTCICSQLEALSGPPAPRHTSTPCFMYMGAQNITTAGQISAASLFHGRVRGSGSLHSGQNMSGTVRIHILPPVCSPHPPPPPADPG
jgi:hypothetical protein